jgi:hypothetical protein
MKLNWRPLYNHAHIKPPPATNVIGTDEAAVLYSRLKPFLWIEHNGRFNCPAEGWPKSRQEHHRHLFREDGYHLAVRWAGNKGKGWRNLTYEEFRAYYGMEGK